MKLFKFFILFPFILLWGSLFAWGQDISTNEPHISFEDFDELENPEDFTWVDNFGWALRAIADPSSLKEDKVIPLYVYEWSDDLCSVETAPAVLGVYGRYNGYNGAILDFSSTRNVEGYVSGVWGSPDSYCTYLNWQQNNFFKLDRDIAHTYREIGVDVFINDYRFFSDIPDANLEYRPPVEPSDYRVAEAASVIGSANTALAGSFTFANVTSPVFVTTNKVSGLTEIGELWGYCQPESRKDQSSTCYESGFEVE